ncbi:DUF6252 family protein [Hymenobacter monticola]|uniref:DUF6252 family protein n=1 Tax=Hymenobacter monticola TaxID=1705399 RepID=A0ABY4BAU4_9BACT|nr:DUF6252 family protein [Hymenobacter monticola]UOE35111.1 DUF6252 family protein [Hymenobacter monticola]
MKKQFLAALYAAALLAAACKKDAPDAGLPAATQEGRNTFGCLVDGQAFGPKPPTGINSSSRDPLEASIYRTDVLVSARGGGYVEFALRNAFRPGTYPLGETQTASYGSYIINGISHYTTATYPGTVTLTRIDTVARIAAGTFEFTALDYRSGKTVTVTQGRFDVRLK